MGINLNHDIFYSTDNVYFKNIIILGMNLALSILQYKTDNN